MCVICQRVPEGAQMCHGECERVCYMPEHICTRAQRVPYDMMCDMP
jgi:hypothetical protein